MESEPHNPWKFCVCYKYSVDDQARVDRQECDKPKDQGEDFSRGESRD